MNQQEEQMPTRVDHFLGVNLTQGVDLSVCRASAHCRPLWTARKSTVDFLTQVDEIPDRMDARLIKGQRC